jgi:two-component system response regulator NreC
MPLSKREKEILRLIVAGESDSEIAERLSIAKSSVQSHVSNMVQRSGATSRGHLIAMALRERWLENDDVTK